jgi:hypothetical protein
MLEIGSHMLPVLQDRSHSSDAKGCQTIPVTSYRHKLQLTHSMQSLAEPFSFPLHPTGQNSVVRRLRLALSKEPNRLIVSLPSPEDENRPSSETLCFVLFFPIQDGEQSPQTRDSECCTPSSEPFRFYSTLFCIK